MYYICMYVCMYVLSGVLVTETGFELVIGFINHSQVVTTITYNYLQLLITLPVVTQFTIVLL
jgi:hypothetical protein